MKTIALITSPGFPAIAESFNCYRWVFQPPFVGHFPRYFSVSFLVCTYILLLGAVQAGDVAVRTCVSALTSRDHLCTVRGRLNNCVPSVCVVFPAKNMRVRLSSEQFACAREFRAGKLASTVPRSSTTDFEQSRRSERAREGRP